MIITYFKSSASSNMTYALYLDITQRIVVFPYRRRLSLNFGK